MNTFLLTPTLSTHQGKRRQQNEDAVRYVYPDDFDRYRQHGALFIVADGVGSRDDGELASRLAVETVAQVYYESSESDLENRLVEAVKAANSAVFNRDGNSSSTLTAALIHNEDLLIAHVGDSRAYRYDGRAFHRVTPNHSAAVDPSQPKRQKLTRAIGHKADVEVDVFHRDVKPGDRLLLVSDGVTRYIDDSQLSKMIHGPTDQVVQGLIETAYQAGGGDNISAVVVSVDEVIQSRGQFTAHHASLTPVIELPKIIPDMIHEHEKPAPPSVPVYEPAPTVSATVPEWKPAPLSANVRQSSRRYTGRRVGILLLLLVLPILGVFLLLRSDDSPSEVSSTSTAVSTEVIEPTSVEIAAQPTDVPTSTLTATPSPTDRPTLTIVPSATFDRFNTPLQTGYTVRFIESALTYRRVGVAVSSITLEVQHPYVIWEIFTDNNEITWYRIYDEDTERSGWISENEIPDYEILEIS